MFDKFGIEIEFLIPGDTTRAFFEDIARLPGHVTTDGSITRDGSAVECYGREYVSDPMPFTKESEDVIAKVCSAIRDNNGFVNRTCGLHVHIDATGLSNEIVIFIARRWARFFDTINKIMPNHRRDNYYCNSLMPNEVREELFGPRTRAADVINSRYKTMNLHSLSKHGTIEFRCHEATLDAENIIRWAKFLRQFLVQSVKKYEDSRQTAPVVVNHESNVNVGALHQQEFSTVNNAIREQILSMYGTHVRFWNGLRRFYNDDVPPRSVATRGKYQRAICDIVRVIFRNTAVNVTVSSPAVKSFINSFSVYDELTSGDRFIPFRARVVERHAVRTRPAPVVNNASYSGENDSFFDGVEIPIVNYFNERIMNFS